MRKAYKLGLLLASATTIVASGFGCGDDNASTADGGSDGSSEGSSSSGSSSSSSSSGGSSSSSSSGAGDATTDSPNDATMNDGSSSGGDAPNDGVSSDGGCDSVSGNTYYVDPTNGSDAATSTGSDMSGGLTASRCAFKTLTHALKVVGSPNAATTILVLGASTVSAGETFPFVVPANVVIKGQGGTVTVKVPATMMNADGGTVAGEGFELDAATSGLESLTIDGQSNTSAEGVHAGTGSAASTYLKNVIVQSFTGTAGVLVDGTGVLTLDEGVQLTSNVDGLSVRGASPAAAGNAIMGNTNQANPTTFSKNTNAGIRVTGAGWITVTGMAGVNGAGSVIASSNATGALIAQDQTNGLPNACAISGFVGWANTLDGLQLQGGSVATVRSSYFGANGIGVDILHATISAAAPDDTSHLDLGQNSGAQAGKNTLQSVPPSDGATSAQNTGAGVCYSILPNKSQTLYAWGNYWVDFAGTAPIDCTAANPGQLSDTPVCTGGVDVGGPGLATNTVHVENCTLH